MTPNLFQFTGPFKEDLFIALKDNEIAGRIAVIINWYEVKQQKTSKIRFGWFDFIDDLEVSELLLRKVIEAGKKNKVKYMEGPMGFSNLDKVGVLTSGFDVIGTMITSYNHCLLYTSPSPRDRG